MSQPQLSVREKAREMFDEKFLNPDIFSSKTPLNPTYSDGKVGLLIEDFRNFIDQIITLALEEKRERVAELLKTPAYNRDQTYDIAIKEVLSVLKQ